MASCVIDTSAVLAHLNDEPGGDVARRWLRDAAASALTLQEIVSKAVDRGVPGHVIPALVERLRLNVHPLDAEAAMAAGLMRTETARHGLSHGDRACLALARQLGLPAVTADRAWAEVASALGVQVKLIL